MNSPVRSVPRLVWRENGVNPIDVDHGSRSLPEETAVALTYNGGAHAVMMATPKDLKDFAVGFSLAEGVVTSPAEIESLDIVDLDGGVELRMWLPQANEDRLRHRRRRIAGPTGCGLCGVDSIGEAMRAAAIVGPGRAFTPRQVMAAMQAITPLQAINIETRAVHAAALWTPESGVVALREDVGRHNALDKLTGALAIEGASASQGLVLLTSRVSVEMVQKSAAMQAAIIVSVSAPTALAFDTAQAAGITLVAVARDDGFEVFTHPHRIQMESDAHAMAGDVAALSLDQRARRIPE